VDPRTHAYISTGLKESKFGIDLKRAEEALGIVKASPRLNLRGVHLHIGSQITSDSRHAEAVTKTLSFLAEIRAQGFRPEFFNIGGGFGISYRGREGLALSAFARQIVPIVRQTGLRMLTEPGRYIAGNSGILLTRVIYTKEGAVKPYAIVDAAMTELLRPSIYQAYHGIWSAEHAPRILPDGQFRHWDVVGPVCESGDFLAKDRRLPDPREGELMAVFSAGAYGFCMSSNYNTRPRPAEVLVDGAEARVIRERESYDDLLRHEMVGLARTV
jgi:diaminopimelate decarboxylase